MKIWQKLTYYGIYVMGILLILSSIGALIEIQIIHFILFVSMGIILVIFSVIIHSYFEENSPEKKRMEELNLM